ncbi:uncharacterized protein LOC106091731 isoform X2 [Stomoxys calcitrans]|uniref:uncharacterized protein LOC106091731 isoform X2 n=1 Tax=Stomoxys calcitrans TaxID=35570 RepID=UPI0027E3A16A|nr:uncharacterized protein LOC106091731 isoform X2 [Stomoxys calcitrans]
MANTNSSEKAYLVKKRNCTDPEVKVVTIPRLPQTRIPDVTEDEECYTDGDTSSSFSLQECMDEFRARRVRRVSSQSRAEDKRGFTDISDNTEMDLINQNLCNREQERKRKPCKNGFCYCFASDSGDSSACNRRFGTSNSRATRHYRHSVCNQDVGNEKPKRNLPEDIDRSCKDSKTCSLKGRQFTAISRLDTSHKDDPLIHIIQELRDNCVISEVRVNRRLLQTNRKINSENCVKRYLKKTSLSPKENTVRSYSQNTPFEIHAPSAPPIENIFEETPDKIVCKSNRRNGAGGLLLQKRISKTNIKYKANGPTKPPLKPPRSSISFDDKSSVTNMSTSSSVREAECILDAFLASRCSKNSKKMKQNLQHNAPKMLSNRNNIRGKEKRMSYPLAQNDRVYDAKQVFRTYPSLSDVERLVVSKKYSQDVKNISTLKEHQQKVIGKGWHNTKIRDMLNYDCNLNDKEFYTKKPQAEPQQTKHTVGWHVQPKVDLDTVDGIGCHNIDSNVRYKDTPVKPEIVEAINIDSPRTWAENLRSVYTWSPKNPSVQKNRKSNFRLNSKEFLKTSKEKILRLVSPKKDNKNRLHVKIQKTPYRNVGIQTTSDDFRFEINKQTPPGSYHSPQHASLNPSSSFIKPRVSTTNEVDSGHAKFDFSRHIHSPPKKPNRSSQRKLHFPLNCSALCTGKHENSVTTPPTEVKTYRSFNGELDQDVSLSKMNFILCDIRAKLESSDEHAARTFKETEYGAREPIINFNENIEVRNEHEPIAREPIYSEIEDESMHISESPNFENQTEVKHFNLEHNPNVLYALINKHNKGNNVGVEVKDLVVTQKPECLVPLGKILHDSIKSNSVPLRKPLLSPLREPSGGDSISHTSAISLCDQFHSKSMNNVRVMEHHSPPKRQRNLSKSDLSLHCSEIFLENLCGSELSQKCQYNGKDGRSNSKVDNFDLKQSHMFLSQSLRNDNVTYESEKYLPDDVVSYELPIENIYEANVSICDEFINGSDVVSPPSSNNQSTPKKPSFTTKDDEEQLKVDVKLDYISKLKGNSITSCPNTPNKSFEVVNLSTVENFSRSVSLNEISVYQMKTKKTMPTKFLPKPNYRKLKTVLHTSFRLSKDFIKKGKEKLPSSIKVMRSSSEDTTSTRKNVLDQESAMNSNHDLDPFSFLQQSLSITDQLAHVVNICRQFTGSAISTEVVEAERLLLFSTLRREKQQPNLPLSYGKSLEKQAMNFLFIDEMCLPIHADTYHDKFYKYFYIVTFDCGGIIRSSQSAECKQGSAVFRDCGIEFTMRLELNEKVDQLAVHCNIFMLRLRKVSNPSLQTTEATYSELNGSSTSTSSSVPKEIVSRFRLQGSFKLDWKSFIPYDYIEKEATSSDRIVLRANRSMRLLLTSATTSSNSIAGDIKLKGRSELHIPKREHQGYLNVEDPYSQHNWNRRWCRLDGMNLQVWRDENILNESPLLSLDLYTNAQKFVRQAARDLCARPRAFFLVGNIRKAGEVASTVAVFFSADTQEDLDIWLNSLNGIFQLIKICLV